MKKNYDVALRTHHIRLFFELHFLNDENNIRKTMLEDVYKKRDINRTIRILKKVAKPGIRIKVLADMDDICKRCSVKKAKGCKKGTNLADLMTGACLGIWVGEIYSSEKILEILERLKERHGGYINE